MVECTEHLDVKQLQQCTYYCLNKEMHTSISDIHVDSFNHPETYIILFKMFIVKYRWFNAMTYFYFTKMRRSI